MKITSISLRALGFGLKIREMDRREATAQERRVKNNLKLPKVQEQAQLFINNSSTDIRLGESQGPLDFRMLRNTTGPNAPLGRQKPDCRRENIQTSPG